MRSRLLRRDPAPVAVAFSGGGDSLALLLAARTWAAAYGRTLLALTVDHGLQPESAGWTRFCRERAAGLGVEHRTLAWRGDKPATGVSAAARGARHRLLADAARSAGAAVILMGHTADDVAEAAVMRRAGSTTPSPRFWSPSPVWPEGRGIFLLRPLLGVRRAALRAALLALGETWIDDPGNVDAGSARARARALIADAPLDDAPAIFCPLSSAPPVELGVVEAGAGGDLFLPIDRLSDAADGLRLLGAALLCAAGAERPPRRERLARLMTRLAAREPFSATLAGCRVASDGARAHLARDAGDVRRRALADTPLRQGETTVWDGRFEFAPRVAGARVGGSAGHARRLARDLLGDLRGLPPATRLALPLVTHADGRRTLPTLRPDPAVDVSLLAPARLAAAVEAILDEAGLRRMAKPARLY